MRAIVGLMGVAAALGAAGSAGAQTPSAVAQVDALRACGTITKKSARLACFDAMASAGVSSAPAAPAAPMASAPAAPPAYVASAPVAAPAAVAPQPSFGGEALPAARAARAQQPSSIEAQVVAASDSGIGHWLITLDDGARWQMTETVSQFQPPRPGETVRIRKGALGSYRMDVGKQGSVNVQRIS